MLFINTVCISYFKLEKKKRRENIFYIGGKLFSEVNFKFYELI